MRYFMIYYNKEVGGFFAGNNDRFKQFENIYDIPWCEFFKENDNYLEVEMNDNTKARFVRNGYLAISLINDKDMGAFLFYFEHEYSKESQSTCKGLWNQIGYENLLADKYQILSKQIRNYIREEKINNLI